MKGVPNQQWLLIWSVSGQTGLNPLLHPCFVYPPFFVVRNPNWVWNNKVSGGMYSLENHFWWEFFAINVTVKLPFTAPHDFSGTVRLPLNSRFWLDGISNRMGVSSMLKILLKEYPYWWQAAIMNRWNCIVFSSRSFRRCWASVVFVCSVMEWRRFQMTYQRTDALNSGSLQNSLAFNRNISPLTAIAKMSKMWN